VSPVKPVGEQACEATRGREGREGEAKQSERAMDGGGSATERLAQLGERARAGGGENLRVVVRVRPPLEQERGSSSRPYQESVLAQPEANTVLIAEDVDAALRQGDPAAHRFTFDRVYGQESQQHELYSASARDAVFSTLNGFNASMIAYGQTGTGKTFTMEGQRSSMDSYSSIIHRNPSVRLHISYPNLIFSLSDPLHPNRSNRRLRPPPRATKLLPSVASFPVLSRTSSATLNPIAAPRPSTLYAPPIFKSITRSSQISSNRTAPTSPSAKTSAVGSSLKACPSGLFAAPPKSMASWSAAPPNAPPAVPN